ncbi:hypothetical protein KBX06_26875 [Micromonospora sp. C31]|uniref:hypothetical protein n=1 Tax=Micromonospora sp. C31 TaxID=2824876 RepID=UPI001B35D39A|nr:hypothetical protein [Micromonospora sp. C31]MBQ1076745.1 hypothetical protein [Micromonospora sp. C31]
MADATTWIRETRVAVDRASDAVRLQGDLDDLGQRDEELEDALRELTALAQAATFGRGDWWKGVDATPDLWTQVRSAQRGLDRRQLGAVVHLLNKLKVQVRDAVQGGWRAHVASRAGNAQELRDLAKALADVEGLEDVAPKLDAALGHLARLERKPPDADSVEILAEVTQLLALLEQRLPPAVKGFVSAATQGGAALDSVNDDVRDWLVDNNALHNFRVVPGRPQGGQSA